MIDTSAPIEVANRLQGFDYASRSIVAEAEAVERSGRSVHYLNIGDPVLFLSDGVFLERQATFRRVTRLADIRGKRFKIVKPDI